MAVYSNMGHISSHFLLTAEATMCRKQIESLLDGKPDTRSVLDDNEYVVFFLNTTVFDGQHETEWAPAA